MGEMNMGHPKSSKLAASMAVAFGVAASTGAALAAAPAAPPLEADLILSNAKIYTPAGWAQSLAVKNGVLPLKLRCTGTMAVSCRGSINVDWDGIPAARTPFKVFPNQSQTLPIQLSIFSQTTVRYWAGGRRENPCRPVGRRQRGVRACIAR